MSSSESQELIQELASELATCRQNPLLSEVEFIWFCKKEIFLFSEFSQAIPVSFKIVDYLEMTQGMEITCHCITLSAFILYMRSWIHLGFLLHGRHI